MRSNDQSSKGNEAAKLGTQSYAVVPPTADQIPTTSADRAADERRLIERLLAILAPEQRAITIETLEADEARVYAVRDNKEAAELFGRIYAIRDAERAHQQSVEMRAAATRYKAPVTVALVDSFKSSQVRARVIRDPIVQPDNIVVLARSSLSPAVVQAAFALLDESRRRHGEIAGKRVEMLVRSGRKERPLSQSAVDSAQALIDRLQKAPRREVPHVGRSIVAMTIEVDPVAKDRSRP